MLVQHISSGYSDELLYRQLCQSISEYEPKIFQKMFVPVRRPELINKNPSEINQLAVNYSYILRPHHRILFRKKIRDIYEDLSSVANLRNVDLVHAHFLYSDGAVALKINERFSTPYITAVRSTDINIFLKFRPDLKLLALRILQKASKVICLNYPYKSRLLDSIPSKYRQQIEDKTVVIPNGIENSWLDCVPPPKKVRPGKFRCIYVGKLIKRKRILNLVKAVYLLRTKGLSVDLTVVGSGGDVEQEFLKLLKIYSFIDYRGRVDSRAELRRLLRNSELFVMPSVRETFGLVYIEALSQGLPIIYSKGEAVDGYFDEATVGKKVNPESVSDIARAIASVRENYTAYIQGCTQEADKFSWKRIAERYISIYDEVAK